VLRDVLPDVLREHFVDEGLAAGTPTALVIGTEVGAIKDARGSSLLLQGS
jgi:hypothetical protein